MTLPRYSQYRATSNPWIPEIPLHWDLVSLGSVGRLLKGFGGSKQDASDSGVPCIRYGELYTKFAFLIREATGFVPEQLAFDYFPLERGDIIFAASGEDMADIGRSAVFLGGHPTVCGGDTIVLRPDVEAVPEFLGYASDCIVSKAQKASLGRGTTIKHIYPSELKRVTLAMPPRTEQAAIAQFLERETSTIDVLIGEQERLLTLLDEQRQAIISQALTKGLDPTVPMKESQVSWIGEIPNHWAVAPCRAVFSERRDRNESGSESNYLSLMANTGIILYEEKGDVGNKKPDDLTKCKLVSEGDFVINSMNFGIGSFGASPYTGIVSPVYVVLTPHDGVERFFLQAVFQIRRFQAFAQSYGNGILAHRAAIGWDILKNLRVPLPPIHEQKEIARYISAQSDRIRAAVDAATISLTLLHERRTALITAAVTGQIDVRGLVEPAA